jgi:hypothetical protein
MRLQATLNLEGPPRELPVPGRVADVLDGDDIARRAFARLSYEQQRWLILTVGPRNEGPGLSLVP